MHEYILYNNLIECVNFAKETVRMCNSLLQQRQEQELQNREKVPQTYFTAHSGVLKRIRAVLECGSTRSTLPPQLSESWSRREEIRLGGTWEGRPDTTTIPGGLDFCREGGMKGG